MKSGLEAASRIGGADKEQGIQEGARGLVGWEWGEGRERGAMPCWDPWNHVTSGLKWGSPETPSSRLLV